MKVNKSRGYAFTISGKFLDHPVDFYNGLYSSGSYAGEYRGELVYLSGIACKSFKGGRELYARFKIFEDFHYKDN